LGRPGVSFIGNEAPAFLKFAGIFVSQFNWFALDRRDPKSYLYKKNLVLLVKLSK
jgi:hypothetical protein